MIDKTRFLLKMLRPGNMLIAVITLASGFFISSVSLFQIHFLIDAFALAAAVGFGNIHNDILDIATDQINKPNRPLPSGKVSERTAKICMKILATLSVVLGFMISLTHAAFFILLLALLFFYNSQLKLIAGVKNLAVALLCVSPLFLSYIDGKNMRILFPLAAFAFLLTFVRELLKDLEDMDGDRATNIQTLPLVIGIEPSKRIIQALVAGTSLLLLFPVILKIYHPLFLLLCLFSVIPFLLTALRKCGKNEFRNAQIKIKAAMSCGVLSIIFTFFIRQNFLN